LEGEGWGKLPPLTQNPKGRGKGCCLTKLPPLPLLLQVASPYPKYAATPPTPYPPPPFGEGGKGEGRQHPLPQRGGEEEG